MGGGLPVGRGPLLEWVGDGATGGVSTQSSCNRSARLGLRWDELDAACRLHAKCVCWLDTWVCWCWCALTTTPRPSPAPPSHTHPPSPQGPQLLNGRGHHVRIV